MEKLVVNKESFTFLRNEDIVSVKVKKYALFDSKRKSIVIKTKDKKHIICMLRSKIICYLTIMIILLSL